MYRFIFLTATIVFFAQCSSDNKKDKEKEKQEKENKESDDKKEKKGGDTDYDLSTVDVKDRAEFKKNLEKIEKKHGDQWDFCTCVVKNDSINKAFSKPVGDSEFERLSERLDVIDKHCKAFLAQNPNQTPEERVKHEKQVKKCLKEAGINP
jgi:hypothetical protein